MVEITTEIEIFCSKFQFFVNSFSFVIQSVVTSQDIKKWLLFSTNIAAIDYKTSTNDDNKNKNEIN